MAEMVTVRLYIEGVKVEEDRFPTDPWEPRLIKLTETHPEMLEQLHMLEVVFDDGDHFRFGTDPQCMVLPIPFGIGGTRSELRFKD